MHKCINLTIFNILSLRFTGTKMYTCRGNSHSSDSNGSYFYKNRSSMEDKHMAKICQQEKFSNTSDGLLSCVHTKCDEKSLVHNYTYRQHKRAASKCVFIDVSNSISETILK